jgi:hypothetical protein
VRLSPESFIENLRKSSLIRQKVCQSQRTGIGPRDAYQANPKDQNQDSEKGNAQTKIAKVSSEGKDQFGEESAHANHPT